MSKASTFTAENFNAEVIDSPTPVLVDAFATWCGPCRALAPVVEDLATEFDGRVKVGKLDIDQNPDLAAAYGIASIPTVLVFKGGDVVETIVGLYPKEHYQAVLEAAAA